MRRILLSSLFMCLFLSVSIIGAIHIGRAQPIPDRLAMLHLTDCPPPCWIGITPGVTTIPEAKAYIDAVYATSADYRVEANPLESNDVYLKFMIVTKSNPSGSALIQVSAPVDGRVAWIRFDFFDPSGINPPGIPPTVAELHSILGPPERVIVGMTADQNGLLYGNTSEGMRVDPRTYGQWNAPIYGLHLFGKLMNYTYETCPWDGFAKQYTLYGQNSVVDLGC